MPYYKLSSVFVVFVSFCKCQFHIQGSGVVVVFKKKKKKKDSSYWEIRFPFLVENVLNSSHWGNADTT